MKRAEVPLNLEVELDLREMIQPSVQSAHWIVGALQYSVWREGGEEAWRALPWVAWWHRRCSKEFMKVCEILTRHPECITRTLH